MNFTLKSSETYIPEDFYFVGGDVKMDKALVVTGAITGEQGRFTYSATVEGPNTYNLHVQSGMQLNKSYQDETGYTIDSRALSMYALSDGNKFDRWLIQSGIRDRGGYHPSSLSFDASDFSFTGGDVSIENNLVVNGTLSAKDLDLSGLSFENLDVTNQVNAKYLQSTDGADFGNCCRVFSDGSFRTKGKLSINAASQCYEQALADQFTISSNEDDSNNLLSWKISTFTSTRAGSTIFPLNFVAKNYAFTYGDVAVEQNLTASKNVSVGGDLTVSGTLKAANIAFDGVSAKYANLSGNLTVNGSSEFNQSIYSFAPIVMYARDVEGATVGRMELGSNFNESSEFQGWNIEAKQSYPTQTVYYPLNLSAKNFSFAEGDVTIDKSLTVGGNAAFDDVNISGDVKVGGGLNVKELKVNDFAVMGTGCSSNSIAKVFEITDEGAIEASKSFSLFENKATCQPVHPAFKVEPGYDAEKILRSWNISTAYTTPPTGTSSTAGKSMDALNFEASAFNFTGGDMTIDGKITCKDQLKVAEVETGSLRAKDLTVELNNAADYVFDENYDLKSLGEVEAYVKANKHLPGVPSASEIKDNGMNVSEMSNLLLEKIEELTLHLIRVEKENQALKAEVEALKK